MKPTIGTGSAGTEGEGPQGLWGLLISIAFAYIFVSIFLPESAGRWLWIPLVVIEAVAAIWYILSHRRYQKESEQLRKDLHQINR